MIFFRAQAKNISLDEMKRFNSIDGGDGFGKGLAVSSSADGYDGGSRFGGAWDVLNNESAYDYEDMT